MSVTIKEVISNRDLVKFVKFPFSLYKNHPLWVPPLNIDELNSLKKTNPAFAHCKARYFLAYRDKKIVGRIAGIINYNANSDWGEKNIRFGWIDMIDDIEVTKALTDTVAAWGREEGMETMNGPWGFSDMDKEGLLVDGFDKEPSITTLYNYPYYGEHLERLGFKKEVDWVQGTLTIPEKVPAKLAAFDAIVREKYGLSVIIPRKPKDIRKRGEEIFSVLNDSYVNLHEFTRLTDKQVKMYIGQYMPFINKDMICVIVDKDNRVVGFAITMPSLSEGFRKAKGKLFPFGFIHILKSLKTYKTVECYLIGVIPEYKHKGVNALIFSYLQQNYIKLGFKTLVSNPQLENNLAVQRMFDYYDNETYSRRRCYIRSLNPDAPNTEVAIFAGGCFWGVQHYLSKADGVLKTEAGYIGGSKRNPSYEEVKTGRTGHYEAVRVEFDPSKTTYEALCKLFFEIHDPGQEDGQGPDIGSQYCSAVFYTSDLQKKTTEDIMAYLHKHGHEVNTALEMGSWKTTDMTPAEQIFWPAEDYHQNYYDMKGTSPYCHFRTKKFPDTAEK